MSAEQIILVIGLAVVWAFGKPTRALAVMTINMVAVLGVCYAMDVNAITSFVSLVYMALFDLAAGVYLFKWGGLSRVVAWGYAAAFPIYLIPIATGLYRDATFAILCLIAFSQLGAVSLGSFTGGGGSRWNRRRYNPPHGALASPQVGLQMAKSDNQTDIVGNGCAQ